MHREPWVGGHHFCQHLIVRGVARGQRLEQMELCFGKEGIDLYRPATIGRADIVNGFRRITLFGETLEETDVGESKGFGMHDYIKGTRIRI